METQVKFKMCLILYQEIDMTFTLNLFLENKYLKLLKEVYLEMIKCMSC